MIIDSDRSFSKSHAEFKLLKLNELSELIMNEILVKLSAEYYDLKNVFDQVKVNELSSHRLYDHKIIIKKEN